jgi:hypothetical protein
MSTSDLRSQLIDYFNASQRAHHHAYLATDGYDLEWPMWYAEHMQARLNDLLGGDCTRSELVYLLVAVEKERAGQPAGLPWADFYADFFLQRYPRRQSEDKPTDEQKTG